MPARRTPLAWLLALVVASALTVWIAPPASAGPVHVTVYPNGRDIFPGQKASDLEVDTGTVTQNATATFKNLAGTVVRTMSVPPKCFYDNCFDDGVYNGYEVRWDGTNSGGTLQPAGHYTGTIVLTDADGEQTASLGDVWINHLVTRTSPVSYQETWKDPAMAPYSTIGRCSSVLGQAAGSPYLLRLLSMSRCHSSAGTDDWAFQAQNLNLNDDDHASRIVSVRIGAVGSPVHAGDMATIVVDSSVGSASPPTWRRVVVLDTAGSHVGTTFTPPAGTMTGQYRLLIQGRVVNGNQWRIQYFTAGWTYRAWTR